MLRVAIANMAFSYLLISIADVTALRQIVFWGYQFTVICIESLVFLSLMSILEILDWYFNRGTGTQYFKVTARGMSDQNVFGDSEDGPGFRRQKSFEHHVNLLKQLNEELEHRKLYSGNFDKLSEYCKDQTLSETGTLRARLKQKLKALEDIDERSRSSSDDDDGCLST